MQHSVLRSSGTLLEQLGPSSELAATVMPLLFGAIRRARTAAPESLWRSYAAWRIHFGDEAAGSPAVRAATAAWSREHGCPYEDDPQAWLFALHTWLGIALPLLAAASLPRASMLLADTRVPVRVRLEALAAGELFRSDGIANLASGLLGWYARDGVADSLGSALDSLLAGTRGLPRDAWSADNLRRVYESMIPPEQRHALGEVYTPDSFAARGLDLIDWTPDDDLLDPTCGMGTFLLEALRRRLSSRPRAPAALAVQGLWGFDINALAVLAARTTMAVMLADRLDPDVPVSLPVYVADAIVAASPARLLPDSAQGGPDLELARKLPPVRHIAGNPPWVRWAQLPPAYAAAIKPYCAQANIFGPARYVGGIEPDVSAVVTILAAKKWLARGGRMALYLPTALFSTEAGEGFRRMDDADGAPVAGIKRVQELTALRPFAGMSVPCALVEFCGAEATRYPVAYEVVDKAATTTLWARPIPGTAHGPWLKGMAAEHELWNLIFEGEGGAAYRARKGVTTDCNGVYFVRVIERDGSRVLIENEPSLGRKAGLEHVRAWVETERLFPLLRGRGVSRFRALADPQLAILMAQRGMHGDPDLPAASPGTWEYFRRFEAVLRARGSYRRYQAGKPFWSTWSTGAYTFSPWKVLWREMSGARFCAAMAGPHVGAPWEGKPVVPDHKLYFVPLEDEQEAAYLCAVLNAPAVARAIDAYAAQLSLGVSVVERLRIPRFDRSQQHHVRIAALATYASAAGVSEATERQLDAWALEILAGPKGVERA